MWSDSTAFLSDKYSQLGHFGSSRAAYKWSENMEKIFDNGKVWPYLTGATALVTIMVMLKKIYGTQ